MSAVSNEKAVIFLTVLTVLTANGHFFAVHFRRIFGLFVDFDRFDRFRHASLFGGVVVYTPLSMLHAFGFLFLSLESFLFHEGISVNELTCQRLVIVLDQFSK